MTRTTIAAGLFLACIVGANIATSTYGDVPVGFGLTATAGTFLAGATFILRDLVHVRWGGWATVGLIAAGALVSLLMADPRIVVASVVAFTLSELADLAIYSPLRARGQHIRAAAASNTVGALVDTVLFLAIAGIPILVNTPGQLLAKLTLTAAAVVVMAVTRALLRQPVEQ